MRLLGDENLSPAMVEALREAGHDVIRARTDAPGAGNAAPGSRRSRRPPMIDPLNEDFYSDRWRAAGTDPPPSIRYDGRHRDAQAMRNCGYCSL
ncbi:MAG: DUF5615 family PIN-like protein [Bryobacterales bacterium]|nr:DUF5615 family PIN-like protein [Bryobacterales bacterium]